MNIPTCFDHPADDPILLLHKWQVDICSGNRCAATVLAYLVSVYESDLQAKSDLTTEYRHYTHEAIERGVLNQYGKAAIVRALKALEQGKIIIKHPAKANQYALCTETINSWLGRSRPQHEQAEQNNPDLEPDDSEAISNPAGETGEAKWLS